MKSTSNHLPALLLPPSPNYSGNLWHRRFRVLFSVQSYITRALLQTWTLKVKHIPVSSVHCSARVQWLCVQLCDRLTAGSEEGRTGLGKIHNCSRPGNACNIVLTWLGRNGQSPSASHRALEEDTCGPRLGAPDSKQGSKSSHSRVSCRKKQKLIKL